MALKSVRIPSGCPKPPERPAPRPKPPKEGPIPPHPPLPFMPGCCGPTSTVVLDNIEVVAGDNVTVEKGFVNGVKAFRISTEESDHITVVGGKDITVDTDIDGKNVTYTVNSDVIIPEQTQADWAESDSTEPSFIMNKPGAFTGATEQENGTQGFVPAPLSENRNQFLCGDGTWKDVDNTRECTVPEMQTWIADVDEEENNG